MEPEDEDRESGSADIGTRDYLGYLFQTHHAYERIAACLKAEIAEAKWRNRAARAARLEEELLRISPV